MLQSCNCVNNGTKLIYSCSGAANTGYLADSVARKLMKENYGKMTCLAGIGAQLSGFTESAKSSTENIVIDGCPVACGKVLFENSDLPYRHFILTEYGVEKGKTEITSEVIEEIKNTLIENI